MWPKGHVDLCEFDPLADNFSKLLSLEDFRHERSKEFVFMLRWPSGAGGRTAVWAQRSNPLVEDTVTGFRPIRVCSRASVPLKKSPEPSKALIVGGHPADGEGAYYAIGHRLLKRHTTTRTRTRTIKGLAKTGNASATLCAEVSDATTLVIVA